MLLFFLSLYFHFSASLCCSKIFTWWKFQSRKKKRTAADNSLRRYSLSISVLFFRVVCVFSSACPAINRSPGNESANVTDNTPCTRKKKRKTRSHTEVGVFWEISYKFRCALLNRVVSFLYKVVLSFSAGMMRRPKGVALLLYGTVISWCPGKDPDGDALSPLLINRSPYIITRFVFIYIYTHVLYTIYSFLSSISFLYCHRFVSSCFFVQQHTRQSVSPY